MRWSSWPFYGLVYRTTMKLAHRFNWHYAPPCYPDGDTMLWCHWCGMRDVVKRRTRYVSGSAPECAKWTLPKGSHE